MAKSPHVPASVAGLTPPPAAAPVQTPVASDDLQAQLIALRAENARLTNALGSQKPARALREVSVGWNTLGTRKASGKENTGIVSLHLGDDPDTGAYRGCVNGGAQFWRLLCALLAEKPSAFAQQLLAGIAQRENDLKPY